MSRHLFTCHSIDMRIFSTQLTDNILLLTLYIVSINSLVISNQTANPEHVNISLNPSGFNYFYLAISISFSFKNKTRPGNAQVYYKISTFSWIKKISTVMKIHFLILWIKHSQCSRKLKMEK